MKFETPWIMVSNHYLATLEMYMYVHMYAIWSLVDFV